MMQINESMIAKSLVQHNCKLLGQIEVSDEQYEDILRYLRTWVNSPHPQTVVPSNLMVALGLVQTAIRHYEEGRFWPCFLEQLGFEIPSSKTNYLGQVFYKTVRKYGLFCPHRQGNDFQYVEYIKAHAFVTNSYMPGFFDFSYAYFENNLFRQLSEDLSEDMESLSQFMETTLNSKADTIVSGKQSKKAAKSYRLLKSTRTAFAQCDPDTVTGLFYPVLKMIDSYFYDNKLPEAPGDRFQKAFVQWCAAQAKAETARTRGVRTHRQVLHHKPYLQVNVDREQVYAVIPALKFRQEDCDGSASAEITIGDHSEFFPLEIYQSFGLYISEEQKIPIPSLFDAIEITVHTRSDKIWRIPASNYRIFSSEWESTVRFSRGHNYILVKPGVQTSWAHEEDLIDYTDAYRSFQYFSANIHNESVFYVGNKPLSIIGEFSSEPIFDDPIEYFSVFRDGSRKMTAARSHPSVSFVLEKHKVNGTVLLANDRKYALEGIPEKVCYDWPADSSKLAVTVMLDPLLAGTDGFCSIRLDVPGSGTKPVCEYVLLRDFKCRFSRPRYTYLPEAELTVMTAGHRVQPLDPAWRVLRESDTEITYGIPLEAPKKEVEFLLDADREYRITVPLRVFCYGFSGQDMRTQKADYIWYADLQETLYVRIPGARSAGAYLDRDTSTLVNGVMLEPDLFRIDISELVNTIKAGGKQRCYYINVEYVDNATRHVALPAIYRNVVIDPYFKIYAADGVPYLDLNIIGNAQVYLTAKEHDGDTVFERKPIQSGVTQLPELAMDKLYDLFPLMEESDEFGLSVFESPLKPMIRVGAVDYGDLTGCRLPISGLIHGKDVLELNYDYFLDLREKEADGSYTGYAYGLKIVSGKGKRQYERNALGKIAKFQLGKVRVMTNDSEGELAVTLQCYSDVDEDWMLPYYDTREKEVIHCDDDRLESSFPLLDDEYCYYLVDTNKLKRIR